MTFPGKGPALSLVTLLLVAAPPVLGQPAGEPVGAGPGPESVAPHRDACVACHAVLDEDLPPGERITSTYLEDVHLHRGLGCADCHGGNPTAFDDEDAAMWDSKSFVGAPKKADLPALCGRCHSDPAYMRHFNPRPETDQVSQYYTSRHGILLKQGENRVAGCTDCHGVHGIREVDNPQAAVYPLNVPATCAICHGDAGLMSTFGLASDQYQKYRTSVHGVALLERRDLGSPACNDCHGNHGATPPDVDDIANICGNCHLNNHDLFQQSHLKDVFVKADIPLCIGCHNKHDIAKPTDEFLDWRGESLCHHCHQDGQPAQAMATTFYSIIDSLKSRIQLADSLVERAEQKGMEVGELLFSLEDAHRALIQTRTSIHSFNEEIVRESARPGNEAALASVAGAEQLLEEVGIRRRGLFFASLIITFLVVMIYLKVRQIERRK